MAREFNAGGIKSPLPKIPFYLDTAPTQSLKGAIVSLSGNVFWQSRIATEPAQVKKPIELQQGEAVITKDDGRATIVFNNKLNASVSPKTEVDLIQTLQENILLEQDTGNAIYDNLSDASFSIRSRNLLIRVNNGSISLSVDNTNPFITVYVKKGSVTAAYNDVNYITRLFTITQGNSLIFETDTKTADIEPFQ